MNAGTLILASRDAGLGDALSDLTGLLQLPVLLLALAMLLLTGLESGRLFTELLRRSAGGRGRRLRHTARQALAAGDDPLAATTFARQAPSAPAAAAVLAFATNPTNTEYALADYEHAAQRRLDRTRLLVRAGPALGLMGTLIPLAPGLTALGRGDLPSLTDDLRRAFAATIVGILVGTVAYAITLTRTRLYGEDLTQLERAAEDGPAEDGDRADGDDRAVPR